MRLLTLATLLTFPLLAAEATVLPVTRFQSVEASQGAHVTVRHGSVQRVVVLDGDPRCLQVRVAAGERLLIENSGRDCHRGGRTQIEVVTPSLSAVSVAHGGSLQVLGAFPAQTSIRAAVEQGGTIDIRSIAADRVEASVYSGGRIFTSPRTTLTATVESGGVITYWGDVDDVRRSVRHGGVVARGRAEDAEIPLSKFDLNAIAPHRH